MLVSMWSDQTSDTLLTEAWHSTVILGTLAHPKLTLPALMTQQFQS